MPRFAGAFGNFATKGVAYVTKSEKENFHIDEEIVETAQAQQQAQAEGGMIPADDKRAIMAIARRAADLYRALNGAHINPNDIRDEIECVHHDVVHLRLREMLSADAGNLMHDVAGIHQHLDINTVPPTLTDCFVPRFAAYSLSPDAA